MRITIISIVTIFLIPFQSNALRRSYQDFCISSHDSEFIVRVHNDKADYYKLEKDSKNYSFIFGFDLLSENYGPNAVLISPDEKYLVVKEQQGYGDNDIASVYSMTSHKLIKTFASIDINSNTPQESIRADSKSWKPKFTDFNKVYIPITSGAVEINLDSMSISRRFHIYDDTEKIALPKRIIKSREIFYNLCIAVMAVVIFYLLRKIKISNQRVDLTR